ncbi:MAG: peptidylprolyl isomerase [Flavobacterium sp.]|nr:MAG: peptidylprolyl isomerase [Flavobacterium sp.]
MASEMVYRNFAKETSHAIRYLLAVAFGLLFISCSDPKFKPEWTKERAPEQFSAQFETTKGNFEITVTRSFSPHAADRFYQLVRHGYYDNSIFYRVVPDFVAQFGNTDTVVMNKWRAVRIPDEKVICGNVRGTVSFARSAPETRDLEVFINLKDNRTLDTLNFEGVRGFPAFGKVTKGIDVVDKLYSGYGESTMTDENLYLNRAAFYRSFPKLDLIKSAHIMNDK